MSFLKAIFLGEGHKYQNMEHLRRFWDVEKSDTSVKLMLRFSTRAKSSSSCYVIRKSSWCFCFKIMQDIKDAFLTKILKNPSQ